MKTISRNCRGIKSVEKWKQVSKIVEKVKTIFRNCREIEFVEKWNQVSEIVEKFILVD